MQFEFKSKQKKSEVQRIVDQNIRRFLEEYGAFKEKELPTSKQEDLKAPDLVDWFIDDLEECQKQGESEC